MLIGSATSRVWSVMGSRRSWCGRSSFGSFAVRRELDASSRQSPSARLKKSIAPCRKRRLLRKSLHGAILFLRRALGDCLEEASNSRRTANEPNDDRPHQDLRDPITDQTRDVALPINIRAEMLDGSGQRKLPNDD